MCRFPEGEHLLSEFGPYAPCNVIVFTDGFPGANTDDSMQQSLGAVQFPIPSSVHFVLVADGSELNTACADSYRALSEKNATNTGSVVVPKGQLATVQHDIFTVFLVCVSDLLQVFVRLYFWKLKNLIIFKLLVSTECTT